MKKLLFILLLLPFVFSCSDDDKDDTWNQNVVNLRFSGNIENNNILDFSFVPDDKVYVSVFGNGWRGADFFTYSKKVLPDNTVEITIHDVDRNNTFVGIISNDTKTMTHIGYPTGDLTYIVIKGSPLKIKDGTIFYKK